MKSLLQRIAAVRERLESTPFFRSGLVYILIPCLLLLQWLMIQMCYRSLPDCFTTGIQYILAECALLLTAESLLALCTGRWWIGTLVTVLISYVYGVLNYYVIDLHGTPVSVRDAGNIGTAGEVLNGYTLEIGSRVIGQTVLLLLCLLGVYTLRRIGLKQERYDVTRTVTRAAVLLCSGVCIFFSFFAPNPLKPAQTRSWDWDEPLVTYGSLSCLLENALSADEVLLVPEGCSDETAAEAAQLYEPIQRENAVTPDIIFILNETYYDLSLITDLETDTDPFAALNRRDDLIRGYAVNPVTGGGTNCSEYELLTGLSLYPTPGITPFQSIDMASTDSVVSRLEALGYSSLSVNSECEENYYRNTGYPALGFDRVYFEQHFTNREYYFDRGYETDESLYRALLDWYGQMGDGPRFAYLLTIQNHGGYTTCAPETDTVHVLNDYGKYNSEMDEFLTSISLSAQAFSDLLDRLAQSDRPTVVCMVGDHTCCFAPKIADESLTRDERELLLRSVPYVVWSNCGFDRSWLPETVSLHSLSSCVLAGAGVQLSGYDSYVAQMCRTIPVFLSGGAWYDADGVRHEAESVADMPEELRGYISLVCNNLGGEDRLDEFFCGD